MLILRLTTISVSEAVTATPNIVAQIALFALRNSKIFPGGSAPLASRLDPEQLQQLYHQALRLNTELPISSSTTL